MPKFFHCIQVNLKQQDIESTLHNFFLDTVENYRVIVCKFSRGNLDTEAFMLILEREIFENVKDQITELNADNALLTIGLRLRLSNTVNGPKVCTIFSVKGEEKELITKCSELDFPLLYPELN